ncbi:adenylate/guanylate cyclase with integral membrane sensor [Kribbella flavida DSM 17836]|uniref:Adenylate/guanylate cyclase with integral membrane sensor n=1 Tax=Kribbella flavida (strain DSM 17836 / JCM 10339 / NBRC 14399) TaxID=479435 RepID=D2PMY5_KRIFD|nr:adenylate/guanylate cyclase domain-containing protein [Kribbella flavida]ADB32687.1 adenylate/guanylate cyclase with integral membrane sensor [Kribbella flavida DSM 17836]
MVPESRPELVLQRRPFGSWLLGPADQSPRMLRVRAQILLTFFSIGTNVIGALVVFVLAVWVLPGPASTDGSATTDGLAPVRWIAFPAYFVLALLVGAVWSTRFALRVTNWVLEERPATRKEQIATLQLPLRLTMIQVLLWLLATIVFTALTLVLEPESVLRVLVTTLDGGVVTCAASYLFAEFALRPIAARALADQAPPRRLLAAGLKARTVFFWAAGSAVPVLGLMLTAVIALIEGDVSATRLSVIILVLGGIVLVCGWILTLLSARSVVAPVRSVRNALTVIGGGDLDVSIPVFDGTELGSLQSGFNQMAAGLRERERIRDLFGRYVGADVVREALTSDALGGEERFTAVLFVDLVGSTELAATRAPAEVVQLLNRFFGIVVDEVDRNGGFVNKFAGDAVLAVFGAPTELPDAAGSALRTGRTLARRLAEELPEATAGIGVTAGIVVAGTVGDVRRHEYTVIGDPVNEAARLTELAKVTPARLVASMTAVDQAARTEATHWHPGEDVTVRGRPTPTRLAHPTD